VDLGVRQGCIGSPSLFAVFIDGVVEEVTKLGYGAHVSESILIAILLYANDIMLMVETPEELQVQLDRVTGYCRKWGLTPSPTKTKVLVINQRGTQNNHGTDVNSVNNENSWSIKLNGAELERVEHFKYLDVTISSDDTYTQHIKEVTAKANNRIQALRPVLINKNFRVSTRIRIYETLVKPILTYGSHIWWVGDSSPDLKKLKTLEHEAL
jgi:hypothetical protein